MYLKFPSFYITSKEQSYKGINYTFICISISLSIYFSRLRLVEVFLGRADNILTKTESRPKSKLQKNKLHISHTISLSCFPLPLLLIVFGNCVNYF